MDKLQLSLGSKVKIKLVQPNIKCIGRDDVVCFYRGKIVSEDDEYFTIRFKHKGLLKDFLYSKKYLIFVEESIKDLVLI